MGLFSNYVSTKDPSNSKGHKQVIRVSDAPYRVLTVLKKYMEDNGFGNIVFNEEYNDLYGERLGYEVSFVVASYEGYSIIQMSVYDEAKRLRVRSEFKRIYEELETLFADKIAKEN